MSKANQVIKNLADADLKTRFNKYNDGVRVCDFYSLLYLNNGFYCTTDERIEVALYWCSVMREHFPNDILMVQLPSYPPHGDHATVTDEVPY